MLQRIAALAVLLSSVYAQAQWKQVETLHFDWAGPGQTATFILELPVEHEDLGDFTRLRIQTPGHPEFVLTDEDGLVKFRKGNCPSLDFCKRKNLVASDRLLLLPVAGRRPVLFVFGWEYASSPGSLHAIALQKDGAPYELFAEKEFSLSDFVDLDGDGLPEIIGKRCFSQGWGNDLLTYDPYSVFRLPKSQTGNATYSLELSERYNVEHYYGWVGPNCSEEYAVVLHPPGGGKPVIVKSKEAEKLFERK